MRSNITGFILKLLCFLLLFPNLYAQLPRLEVSDNGRFIVTEQQKPFFYLGDTGWEMIHRLNRNEIQHYLQNRSAKGFNVIQVVLLGEINGVTVPNAEGHLPLIDQDPTQPNDDYFALVDYALKEAEKFGIYLAILPTWGSHVEDISHPLFDNVALFTHENAYQYTRKLASRWKSQSNIIWILGGDRSPEGHEEIWESMAKGIEAVREDQLITYHIYGGRSSGEVFHDADWLDFNMLQSGHMHPAAPNYEMVTKDYVRTPIKPVLDGEPAYEGMNIGFSPAADRFGEFDVRRSGYWSVFAGACGYTYGHNCIWQMYATGRKAIINAHIPWDEAIHAPGSYQVGYLKNLMLSRPFLTRIPDQSILVGSGESWPPEGTPSNHVVATRDQLTDGNASYLMIYYPYPYRVNINTQQLNGDQLRAWWFDPRTGHSFLIGEYPNKGTFSVPSNHRIREGMGSPDWVLVLDDASRNYPAPGQFSIE